MDELGTKETALQAMEAGQGFLQSGKHEQALAAFARGEALFGKTGDLGLQARAGTNKALVLVHLKRFEREYPESLGWYRGVLSLHAAAGRERKRSLTAENVARLEMAPAEAAE